MSNLNMLLAQVHNMPTMRGGPSVDAIRKTIAQALDAEDKNNASMYPGRAIGGTGDTGLASNDGAGYADMLSGQQAYMGLDAYLQGKPEPNVRQYQQPDAYAVSPATGNANYAPSGTSALAGGDDVLRGIQNATLAKARSRYEQGTK